MDIFKLLIILITFIIFFNNYENQDFVPNDVNVLDISLKTNDGHLTLNLCENVLNYGGTYYEYRFLKKFFSITTYFDDINYLTILVNGELRELAEGSLIDKINLH